jgi:phage regulator Rha-like protein
MNTAMEIKIIQSKIHEIRGQRVILDFNLAEMYDVETKVLNQAIKRNIERFPEDFMFKLTAKEWRNLAFPKEVKPAIQDLTRWSQFVTTSQKYRPKASATFAFTEHGVTMLASILRSEKAIEMNIAIVRAFVALRQFVINYDKLAKEIEELKLITGNHNAQLNQIYDVLENIMDEKAEQRKWGERERIGFKPNK